MKTVGLVQADGIVYRQGDISRSNISQVKAFLLVALENNTKDCLCLDMGQVGFIDSAGVGILATLYALSKHQGSNLILCRVTPPVHIVLELTRLDQVLQISSGFFNPLFNPLDIYPA